MKKNQVFVGEVIGELDGLGQPFLEAIVADQAAIAKGKITFAGTCESKKHPGETRAFALCRGVTEAEAKSFCVAWKDSIAACSNKKNLRIRVSLPPVCPDPTSMWTVSE